MLGLIAGVVGYVVTLYFVHAPDFAANFDNWMSSLVLWMSPWAGVVLADFYLLRRKKIDVAQLYADPKASIYGDVNWVGIGAFLLGLVVRLAVRVRPGRDRCRATSPGTSCRVATCPGW